jgi:hypothetical protein
VRFIAAHVFPALESSFSFESLKLFWPGISLGVQRDRGSIWRRAELLYFFAGQHINGQNLLFVAEQRSCKNLAKETPSAKLASRGIMGVCRKFSVVVSDVAG